MPADYSFYYDFKSELTIRDWKKTTLSGDSELWEGHIVLPEHVCHQAGSTYMLLWPDYEVVTEINGKPIGDVSRSLYMGRNIGRSFMPVTLKPGDNTITLLVFPPSWWDAEKYGEYTFPVGFVPDFAEVEKTPFYQKKIDFTAETLSVKEGLRENDLSGTPGAGRMTTPGRFGFTKGDGLLDHAMSSFGIVDKLYWCGHPRHPLPYRWGYCVLPGDEQAHKSRDDIKKFGDEIKINQLSVNWRSQGVEIKYSLASPGVYVTAQNKEMRISQLEFAGSPQYVMTSDAVTDIASFDPASMRENFLLLFGTREDLEVPILIVLDQKPEKLEFTYKANRISSITFKGCRRMITATPFGLEALEPQTPSDTEFLKSALARCRFWSQALLAFPSECVDFFRIDEDAQLCRITQKYTHEILTDAWNTAALKLAPYPPAAALSGRGGFDPASTDLQFPTKYGPFLAVAGDCSTYTLPLMPDEIRFPLEKEGGQAAERLKNDLKEFFDFQDQFPDDVRSYAYPGSSLERWGFAGMLHHFLPEEYRAKLAQRAGISIGSACDPDGTYTCLLTEHSYLYSWKEHSYQDTLDYYYGPRMLQKVMKNFYPRKEPFTGVEYLICYLNVSRLRDDKNYTDYEISNTPDPYIENDWGLGVTFYTLYMCALTSGDFSNIRKHWQTLKKMYEYLDVYHDWACLSAGYAERGSVWCEGANYGAYTAFPRLAKAVGDQAGYEYGQYLAAKELALRMAVYRSSQNYFCKCYKVPPFGITKAFREEESPSMQFQGVPGELDHDRLRLAQLHTYITEGSFPELLRHYRKLLPEEHRDLMNRYLAQMLDPERNRISYFWSRQLTPTMILLDLADDPTYPAEKLLQEYQKAEEMDCMIRHCRDIGTFSTFQPEGLYPAMILAQLEAREQPLYLMHWEDLQIRKALWKDGNKAEICYAVTDHAPVLYCKLKDKRTFKHCSQPYQVKNDLLILRPERTADRIEIVFE